MATAKHCRTRRINDDKSDVLTESIRQKLKLEYEEGPQRYAERWAKRAVRTGPTIGAQRRGKVKRKGTCNDTRRTRWARRDLDPENQESNR